MKKSNYKISNHGKLRMKERVSLKHREMRNLFRLALKNGLYVGEIKDAKFKRYLAPKQKFNSCLKVYQDYIFIYSKNRHQLYTMYPVPDEFKGKR